MKIKNTAVLRQRADWHREMEHYAGGTYGEAKFNGETKFKACAIGCLVTPTPKEDVAFETFLRAEFEPAEETGYWRDFRMSDDEMVERLEDQFGLNDNLLRVIEAIFESIYTQEAKADFVHDVAHAMPEGRDLKGDEVNVFREAGESWRDQAQSFIDWLKDGAPEPTTA